MFSSVCVLRNSSLGPNFSQKIGSFLRKKKEKIPFSLLWRIFCSKMGPGGCCLGLFIHGFFKENEL